MMLLAMILFSQSSLSSEAARLLAHYEVVAWHVPDGEVTKYPSGIVNFPKPQQGKSILTELNATQFFEYKRMCGYEWDTSPLFPLVGVGTDTTGESDVIDTLSSLARQKDFNWGHFLGSYNSRKDKYGDRIVDQGVPLKDFYPATSAYFVQNYAAGMQKSVTPETLCSLRTSPSLALKDSSGNTFFCNLDKRKDASEALRSLFGTQTSTAEVRVPKTLADALSAEVFTVPAGGITMSLSSYLQTIRQFSGCRLYMDKRVLGEKVFIDAKSEMRMSGSDMARLMALAMNMYWRKVGADYFFGISPQLPERLAADTAAANLKYRAVPLLEKLAEYGQLLKGVTAAQFLQAMNRWQSFDPSDLVSLRSLIEGGPTELAKFDSFVAKVAGGQIMANLRMGGDILIKPPITDMMNPPTWDTGGEFSIGQ